VAPAERVRRRLTPATGVLLTAVLFATLFLVAIAHTVLVQGQVRLDALDSQLTVEQARYQELRTDVAEMESPSRVVQAAEELGMVSPQDLVYLQPEAPDPCAGATPPAPADEAGDPNDLASGADNTWGDMKPLLETPAP
jgi:cell division protein FtsL